MLRGGVIGGTVLFSESPVLSRKYRFSSDFETYIFHLCWVEIVVSSSRLLTASSPSPLAPGGRRPRPSVPRGGPWPASIDFVEMYRRSGAAAAGATNILAWVPTLEGPGGPLRNRTASGLASQQTRQHARW